MKDDVTIIGIQLERIDQMKKNSATTAKVGPVSSTHTTDHSEATIAYCIVAQNYLYTWVNLFDNGVGIFNKIKDYYDYNTLEDAITELFKGKLTTDTENHSGEGFFFTSRTLY